MFNLWLSPFAIFSKAEHNLIGLEECDENGTIVSQSEQYGLFPIHVPEKGTEYPAEDPTYQVDVVAVHGLGGDAYRTWEHANGNMWLRHISDELPGARVYTYGYDSSVAFSRGTATLRDFSRILLNLIRLTRKTESDQKRALIFVCHSMGGLVVKQAFLIANNEKSMYPGIKDAITAILFFGTPHHGSSSASYAAVLSNIANVLLFGSQASRIVGGFRTELLKALQINEGELLRLAEEFRVHTPGIQISSFIEQETMRGMMERIVDNRSGEVGAATERILPMMGRDHRQLCKYASSKSQSLQMIFEELKDGAKGSSIMFGKSTRMDTALSGMKELFLTKSPMTQVNELLLKATEYGNFTAVIQLLENDAELHSFDDQLRTPLHLACLQSHNTIIQYLVLKRGANVHETDANLMRPLHLAAMKGNDTATTILLQNGAQPDAEDKDGFTALHWAAIAGSNLTTNALLRAGADITKNTHNGDLPVRLARRNHNFTVMKSLQSYGNATGKMALANWRPIGHRAMLTGRAQIERLIIDRIPGVMIQQYDPDGERRKQLSPIARAAEMGDLQTVEDLLDLGVPASPDALYFAALEGHANVVEVLVDLMDDINTSVGWVGNALCAATVSIRPLESIKAAQTLLGRGADPKWQGGYYGNALQGATANNLREMVQLLVEYGADVNAQVGNYGNALTAAARHPLHFQEMASFFIRLGADIDAQGPGVYGNPLQTVIWMGHHDAIGFLLKHGASKTMSGRFGSAMDIAVNGRRFNDLLQERDEILALLEGD